MNNKGFSLIELVTVMAIIAILVSFGVPVYTRATERAKDNEAKANLMLILAAERMYLADNGTYFAPGGVVTDIGIINQNLHLNLNENLWDYAITIDGGLACNVFASRSSAGFNRLYHIDNTLTEVRCIGSCP